MLVLLDECLPRDFGKSLKPHEVCTVPEKGWGGISNGKLLRLTEEAGIQAFITVDQNLVVQNPKAGSKIIVVVLRVLSNKLTDLLPLSGKVVDLLSGNPPAGIYYL